MSLAAVSQEINTLYKNANCPLFKLKFFRLDLRKKLILERLTSLSVDLTNDRHVGVIKMSHITRKPTFWYPTWSDTNQAVQLQKVARGLKFRM